MDNDEDVPAGKLLGVQHVGGLKVGNVIHDTVVDVYCLMLRKKYLKRNTGLYLEASLSLIENDWKIRLKNMFDGNSQFNKNKKWTAILLAVNTGGHFVTLVFNRTKGRDGRILVCDSLSGKKAIRSEKKKEIQTLLEAENGQWTWVDVSCPQQGENNCGLNTMQNIDLGICVVHKKNPG